MSTSVIGPQTYLDSISIPPGLAEWKEMLWEANVNRALALRDYTVRSSEYSSQPWTEYVFTAESILFERGTEF